MNSASMKHWILIVICLLGAIAARAQTISSVAGSGQLLDTELHSQSQPLVVIVRDASGNPVKGATVNWSVAPTGRGALVSAQTTTDATGQTSDTFTAGSNLNGNSFWQATVTATGGGGSVEFTLTIVQSVNGSDDDHVALVSPSITARSISGQAGQQGKVPIQIDVVGAIGGSEQGEGIPGVSLAIVQGDPKDPSTITCSQGNIVYTNATGSATCTPVFGGKVGTGTFSIIIGVTSEFTNFSYQVFAGPAAAFTNVKGNNQSGNPGETLPLFLTATLTDLGGNPVPNTAVTFTTLGAVTLSRVSTATDVNGNIAAIATLGNGAGPATVTVSTAGGVTLTFNLTINVIVTGMSIVSGNQPQTALEGAQFESPLVVQVVDGTTPVPGVTVTFAVASGSATLGASGVTTDQNGEASTTVTAGSIPGPVTVTASASGTRGQASTQFNNLTVIPPGPVCNLPNTFVNGASFVPNKLSPGGVAVINCVSGLADGIQGVVSGDYGAGPQFLPQEIQHVTVEFNEGQSGIFAPIYYLANINGQQSIAIQVPFELYPLTGTTVPVTISANNNTVTLQAPILEAAPGTFEYLLSDGVTKNAIMLHADGTLVTSKKPAMGGESLRAYVTGLTPPFTSTGTSVISSDSFDPVPDVTITTPVLVAINGAGIAAPVVVYAEGMIGVWEVQFVVPTGATANAQALFNIGVPVNGKTIVSKGSRFPIGPLP
jgi:uncharacterized protein (TIGR03437 family)